MQDRPTDRELIDAVAQFLDSELTPTVTDPRLRFRALVAANILHIVTRELEQGDAQLRAEYARLTALLPPSPSGMAVGAELPPSPRGRGAGGEGAPSPHTTGAEGAIPPSPRGRGAGGEGVQTGAGGEGVQTGAGSEGMHTGAGSEGMQTGAGGEGMQTGAGSEGEGVRTGAEGVRTGAEGVGAMGEDAPLPAQIEHLTRELVRRIRAGEADTGAFRDAVFAHVEQTVMDKLRIANPKYLQRITSEPPNHPTT